MKRLGEFSRPQVGVHRYVGEDLMGNARHFGLAPNDSWVTVHVREDNGPHYHILRHFKPGTSTGVMAAMSHEDGIYFDPRKMDYLRGGTVRRTLNADGDLCLSGSLGMYVGADGVFVESEGLKSEAVIGAKRISVKDSGLVDLQGPLMGPGQWVYLPWAPGKGEATMHTSLFYNVSGTVYGRPVRGIVIHENMWHPPGMAWGDSPINQKLMGTWCAFAHEFEDGTVQYGHLANWTSAGCFANIWDNGKHIDSDISATKVEYRQDGFAGRIEFKLANGETWECVTEANGAAIDTWKMAQRIGQNFRTGHKGHVGRVGDTRKRRSWYGIFEVFPDRLKGYAN